MIGSTQTDLHSLPVSIAADLFRSHGFEVLDLGANLPPTSFADRVRTTDDLVAVAISVTTPNQHEEIAATISALRPVTAAPIMVGGSGSRGLTAETLGADGVVESADDALAVIDEWLDAH